jgi:glycosyltransferase involved in cell wall biosynthesis
MVTVTVVTPSFNQSAYLEETIASVLAQRDDVHEYFVVDGGSDDGSADIIERFANQLDWWVSERDRGQCDAIAKGFARATGDILYWINSDDVLLPGALTRVRKAFDANAVLEVAQGYGVAIDAAGRIIHMRRAVLDSARWARLGYLRVHQPATFFRRDLYERIGGLNLDLHCALDTELWYRMFRAGANWGGIADYVAAYRLHDEAKGATLRDRYKQERRLLAERYPEYAPSQLPRAVGRVSYFAAQVASGRTLATRADMQKHRGKPWGDVFQAPDRCAR